MKRIVVYILLAAVLLSGCSQKRMGEQKSIVARALWNSEERELQRDLARWYNLNLRSSISESELRSSYDQILFHRDGVMGYIEFPGENRVMPIVHEGGTEGFVHNALSDFPIGSRGGNAVLCCEENIILSEGDTVILWVLGEKQVYSVGRTGSDNCTLICGEKIYRCGRVESK